METEEGRYSRLLREKAECETRIQLCHPKNMSNPQWVMYCVLLAAAEVALAETRPKSMFDRSLSVTA